MSREGFGAPGAGKEAQPGKKEAPEGIFLFGIP